jgi:hypothetical protein
MIARGLAAAVAAASSQHAAWGVTARLMSRGDSYIRVVPAAAQSDGRRVAVVARRQRLRLRAGDRAQCHRVGCAGGLQR